MKFLLICMFFVVYGSDILKPVDQILESIPKPTAEDGPELVEVEDERAPGDIELEAVYAVNQSEPLNLDETEDISETDIDFDESYEDEEYEVLVEGELSPEDDGGSDPVYAKNESAPIDFESEMVEEKDASVEGELSPEDNGGSDPEYASNVSSPIDFDAAPVEPKQMVEVEGKLPEDDTEKHEAIFEEDEDEEIEDVDTDMVETEGESSDVDEKEAEYATGELPP